MCQFLPLSGPPLHIDSQGKLAPWAYCISGFELGGEARTNEERELKKKKNQLQSALSWDPMTYGGCIYINNYLL